MHNMQGPKTCDNTLQPTPRTFGANAKTNPICGKSKAELGDQQHTTGTLAAPPNYTRRSTDGGGLREGWGKQSCCALSLSLSLSMHMYTIKLIYST